MVDENNSQETKPSDYTRQGDVERYFDTNQVTLDSTSSSTEIIKLRGGQAVIIKALNGNSGNIYIGKKDITSSTGFELGAGESIKIEYLPDKDTGEFLIIYGLPATADDKAGFMIIP